MKKLVRILAVMMIAVLLLSVASCKKKEKVYTVGILQQLEHPALDLATEGFEQALKDLLGDKVVFDYKNAQNDPANCATIATKFVNDNVDLIMANATTALTSCAAATSKIPIVGTSITDYVSAGVIESNDKPGTNVTGASDLAPIDQQIELLTMIAPDVKSVGILYCSSESNSIFQAELAEKALKEKNIEVKIYTVSDSNEIQAVVTKAVDEVEAIYIPTDNTIADNMEVVKNITIPAKIPVICGEENMCKNGGLATLSISYYDMGYEAGKVAYEILVNGADPATTPIVYAAKVTLEYNKEVAELLGIEIPEGIVPIE
ncbi:MAG: ABC transporter substrate-binding protein [Clostridia bacterium]|nr:ABC transporter substrate-binding protein [Clostridia bacterium]